MLGLIFISVFRNSFFVSFLIFSIFFSMVFVLSVRSFIFFSLNEKFVQSIDRVIMEEPGIIRLLIIEFFSFLASFNSYISFNSNNRIGFRCESSVIICFIKKMFLMTQFFVSFEIFINKFVLSFKSLRIGKRFFFHFLIFFSSSFINMGSKNESCFRGEPKGSSASIPQTVKKQKSFFCPFFFVESLLGDCNLDVCHGFRRKGNKIFI